MAAGKKARIARLAGFLCLGLALLNATVAVLAIVIEKDMHAGTRGLAITMSLCVVGIVNLRRSKRRLPPLA